MTLPERDTSRGRRAFRRQIILNFKLYCFILIDAPIYKSPPPPEAKCLFTKITERFRYGLIISRPPIPAPYKRQLRQAVSRFIAGATLWRMNVDNAGHYAI